MEVLSIEVLKEALEPTCNAVSNDLAILVRKELTDYLQHLPEDSEVQKHFTLTEGRTGEWTGHWDETPVCRIKVYRTPFGHSQYSFARVEKC